MNSGSSTTTAPRRRWRSAMRMSFNGLLSVLVRHWILGSVVGPIGPWLLGVGLVNLGRWAGKEGVWFVGEGVRGVGGLVERGGAGDVEGVVGGGVGL